MRAIKCTDGLLELEWSDCRIGSRRLAGMRLEGRSLPLGLSRSEAPSPGPGSSGASLPSIEAPAEVAPLVPRVLTKRGAAAYCSLTDSGFDHWVTTGKLPGPMKGTRRWDKVAIDLALDRLSGIDRSKSLAVTPESTLADWKAKRAAQKAAEAARPTVEPITRQRGANRDRT